MGLTTKASTNHSCDRHFCFFIDDFQENDSVIVMVNGNRIKGRVVGVDQVYNTVSWKDSDDVVRISVLDRFAFLGPFEKDWL